MEYKSNLTATPKFVAGMRQLERIEELIDTIVNAYSETDNADGAELFIKALKGIKPFISIHLANATKKEEENIRKRYGQELDNAIEIIERYWTNYTIIGNIPQEKRNYTIAVDEVYNMTIYLKQTGGLGIPIKEEMDIKKKMVSGLNIEDVEDIIKDLPTDVEGEEDSE